MRRGGIENWADLANIQQPSRLIARCSLVLDRIFTLYTKSCECEGREEGRQAVSPPRARAAHKAHTLRYAVYSVQTTEAIAVLGSHFIQQGEAQGDPRRVSALSSRDAR